MPNQINSVFYNYIFYNYILIMISYFSKKARKNPTAHLQPGYL